MFAGFGVLLLLGVVSASEGYYLSSYPHKRTDITFRPDYDQDYQAGVNYDEYPVVVPKRATLMLDRLLIALQHALEDGGGSSYESRPESSYRNNAPIAHRLVDRSEGRNSPAFAIRSEMASPAAVCAKGFVSVSCGFDVPSYLLQGADVSFNPDYDQDYEAGVNNHEYTVVVPRHEMLMLLRLILASQRPFEDSESTSYESRPESISDPIANLRAYRSPDKSEQTTTVRYAFRKCFFNPVTCFKK